MKTSINSVLKSSLVAMVVLASMFSLNASAATVIADRGTSHADIKRVVATGNIKVILVQNANERVQLDDVDLEKVSIKQVGNTLTVSSSDSNPVTIAVYVKDIYRIDASGKAMVKTAGKFNVKFLQVLLKDDATARVKTSTESIYTVIDGNSKLELLGTTQKHIAKTTGLASIDTDKFAALKTVDESTAAGVSASINKVAVR